MRRDARAPVTALAVAGLDDDGQTQAKQGDLGNQPGASVVASVSVPAAGTKAIGGGTEWQGSGFPVIAERVGGPNLEGEKN